MENLIIEEARICFEVGMYYPFKRTIVPLFSEEEMKNLSLELGPEPRWEEELDE